MTRPRTVRAVRGGYVALVLIVVGSVPLASMADRSSGQSGSFATLQHGPGVTNHPVGVVPSSDIRIPEGWPLDRGGAITCMTCHSELPSLVGGGHANLRDIADETIGEGDFCAKCHVTGGASNAKSMHWMAVGVAHVKADAPSSRSGGGSRQLDAASRRCLSCHDGVNASDYSTGSGRASGSHGDRRRNHPVGVQYTSRRSRTSSVRMKPSSLLPKEVRLTGGVVGCTSCHNLYSPDKYKLAVPIEGSRLCLTCHDMD